MITCQGAQVNCTPTNSFHTSYLGDIDPDVAGYGVGVAGVYLICYRSVIVLKAESMYRLLLPS